MGTTYSIKIAVMPKGLMQDNLQSGIDELLANINHSMSTYEPDSELSRFNQSVTTDWFTVSTQLLTVVKKAQEISVLTHGAFDVTVGPLVNLWGFGPQFHLDNVPTDTAIAQALQLTGHKKLHSRDSPPAIKKDMPRMYVDLSAIAKGYAVDRISEYLDHKAVQHYLVEIGGELRGRGQNSKRIPWQVAVEKRSDELHDVQHVLELKDTAVATSGDYRNYFELNGKRYSHAIDPHTGRPIVHGLTSVTVVANSDMQADALATALLVMGPFEGFHWAEKMRLAALFIIRDADGFSEQTTQAFRSLLSH